MKFGGFTRKFTESAFGQLVDILSTGLSKLTIGDNIDGQVIENMTIPAGSDINVPHSLKEIPKYRIILRQTGGGLITDSPNSPWTDTNIYLNNSGGTDAVATILIVRS
jgi:hypothetical protein